jgi:hypothetical protein
VSYFLRGILGKVLNSNKNQLQGFSFKGCHKVPFSTRDKKEKKSSFTFSSQSSKETKDNNNKISYTWALRPMDGSRSKGDIEGW